MIGLVGKLGRSQSTAPKLEGMVDALECYVAVSADASGEMAAERMAIYRALVDAVRLLFSELLNAVVERHEVAELARRSERQL
jgi:hypothetical protein